MSETDLILKKNDAIRKKNVLLILQQIGLFLLLAGYVFIAVVSRITPPDTKPNINIIDQYQFSEGNEIAVPKVITAGKPYEYKIKGEKFVSNTAEVRQQLVCKVDGSENFITINEFTSDLPKGKYETTRTGVIPVTTRLQESKDCRLQSIASYVFYQTDDQGNEIPLPYSTTGTSNQFELRVPDNQQEPNGNVTPDPGTTPQAVTPLAPAQTQSNTQDNKQTTTSGSGDDPNDGSGGGETERNTPIRDLLNGVTSPVTNLLNRIGE